MFDHFVNFLTAPLKTIFILGTPIIKTDWYQALSTLSICVA